MTDGIDPLQPPEGAPPDNAAAPPPPPPPPPPPSPTGAAAPANPASSKMPLIIGGVALLVVLLAVGLYVILSGDDHTVARRGGTNLPSFTLPTRPTYTVPDAAPVDSDYSVVSAEEVPVKLTSLTDARLQGVGYDLELDGWKVIDRTGTGRTATIAPKGFQLLVLRYELTTNGYGEVRAAIDADGVKHSVRMTSGKGTLIAAIPKGVDDLGIEIVEDETTQSFSLNTGRRSADSPAILYRANRRMAVNNSMQLPLTANSTSSTSCSGPATMDVAFGDAELVWSGADSKISRSSSDLAHQSDPTHAFLVVEVTSVNPRMASGNCSMYPKVPAASVVVTLPDNTQAASTAELTRSTNYLVFDVPADLTTATLRVAPGDGVTDTNSSNTTYNFAGSAGEVPIVFAAN